MIIDKETLFSNGQDITVTAASDYYIDLGVNKDVGPGNPVECWVQVVEAFEGGTSVKVRLDTDDVSAFSSGEVLWESEVIATATLTAGYAFRIRALPDGVQRYLRLYYTVVGTMSAGSITAGIILDRQQNDMS